jgi:phage terminase large subunit GpA-like protein
LKGAQIGGTECGNCWIGYVIHQAPRPMMAVASTVELAKRNSKQRIDPLIEESEVLRERVKERRSRQRQYGTCLAGMWHEVGAPTPCTGWARGVGDRNEPRDCEPGAQHDPAPHSSEPERLVGASP